MSWTLNDKAYPTGTSYHGHKIPVQITGRNSKKFWEKHFGPSNVCFDEYKSTYEYIFTNENGDVATLYDYKHSPSHIGANTPTIAKSLYDFLIDNI